MTMPRQTRFSLCSLVTSALGITLLLPGCIGRGATYVEEDTSTDVTAAGIVAPSDDPKGVIEGDTGEAKPAGVFVSFDRRFQILEGYGAATAWFQDRICGDTPAGLYEMLFPELGIDILRFRNRYERTENNDRDLKQEREILERATKALGHSPRLLMTSWSPPGSLKADGKERCRGNNDTCTLKKKDGKFIYDEFAAYWRKSLEHYESLGVVPEFVSIQNEPDFVPPDWEGCRFDPSENEKYPGYNRALEVVHQQLSTLKHPPKLLGAETLGIHYSKALNYQSVLNKDLLYGMAHHLYEMGTDGVWDWRFPGPPSYVDEMLSIAEGTRLPIFQTEFMTDDDKGKEGGFETAWLIHHSMVDEGAAAFVYWDLIWNGMSGLVGMNGKNPKIRDQYYSVRHFARFTDPGYQRIAADTDAKGLLVSAWVSPDEQQLTVVTLNTGSTPLKVTWDSGGFTTKDGKGYRTTYRIGKSQRWADMGPVGAKTAIRMPSRSVMTVVYNK
jgi:glucuronoarabinoxylan endo-1,4-beta-xylanase